jgi:hypothetical protein
MSTVHAASRFVVASAVNYDPDVAGEDVDEAMFRCGDFLLPRAMRKHARLWSEREYRDAMLRSLPGLFNTEDLMTGGKIKPPGQRVRIRNDAFMYACDTCPQANRTTPPTGNLFRKCRQQPRGGPTFLVSP